ncbi:unnamed protein product, partial [marine sediment metagenome]
GKQMDKVAKVHTGLYERAKELAKTEDISIADAISKLVEDGGAGVPSACQLNAFDAILREQGLTPPRRPDWVWGVTDVLPAGMLAGTKLEPYARARAEAEVRCAIGDELYGKLVAGELTAEEKVGVEVLTGKEVESLARVSPESEPGSPGSEPATEPESPESEPESEPVTVPESEPRRSVT